MSRHLIEKYRQRTAQETGACARPRGGRLMVALVYPNSYYQGMSNLGVQTVYRMLNSRQDTLCERFFLPDPEDLDEHRRTGFPQPLDQAFFDALRDGAPSPIDVYDAVAWSCLIPLSGESIKQGSVPVEIPDFTKGKLEDPNWRKDRHGPAAVI